jgi:hypothetical protein
VETGPWVTRWFRAELRALGLGTGWRYLATTLLLLHRKPKLLPCLFFSLYHLKLHTVGDVDLSHSLGIDFGCAWYESEYDNNADGWYD